MSKKYNSVKTIEDEMGESIAAASNTVTLPSKIVNELKKELKKSVYHEVDIHKIADEVMHRNFVVYMESIAKRSKSKVDEVDCLRGVQVLDAYNQGVLDFISALEKHQ